MNLKETKLVKIWIESADFLKGEFSMPLQVINGGNGGLYLFKIVLDYRGLSISIHAGIHELPLTKDEYDDCIITITATKKSIDDIELSIWRKDFFDKIFNSKLTITGFKDFDKTIGLKASRNIERLMPKAFENKNLRQDFMEDYYRAYNVQTKDRIVIIERKSGLKITTAEMIISEYERFCRFLDGLVESRIIQGN